IITTDGFRIFKNKQKRAWIKDLAKTRGIIILTDSDRAGQIIRNHIKSFVNDGKLYNVYIPQILGKEKRKLEPSKEGTLGVEGLKNNILIDAFKKAGIFSENKKSADITNIDLAEVGLIGADNSAKKRKILLKKLGLPDFLSSKQLLDVLNTSYTKDEFKEQMKTLNDRREKWG
ncbi:MAG: DUF4093 domain-containing protein, partial [Oscillospiraceae bacterium]|nr:DUF4093 domain-containing protein [Oscillospiraceae bacterium]